MSTFETKIDQIRTLFAGCTSPESIYEKIIELGRAAPQISKEKFTADRLVPGCQSVMHLESTYDQGVMSYAAHSDALISNGLAYLLTSVYSGLSPKDVLLNPPAYLQEMNVVASLTPSRANGLASIYLRMKQDAVKFLSA